MLSGCDGTNVCDIGSNGGGGGGTVEGDTGSIDDVETDMFWYRKLLKRCSKQDFSKRLHWQPREVLTLGRICMIMKDGGLDGVAITGRLGLTS